MQALLTKMVERQSAALADIVQSVGAGADSYFEYLLKYWILTGKQVRGPACVL